MTVKRKTTRRKKAAAKVAKPTVADRIQRSQKAFLAAYAKWGIITTACEAAKINRSTYYAWIEDEDFAAQVKEAGEAATDRLEREAIRRATEGERELVLHNGKPVTHNGKLVYRSRRSDLLLIFTLKALRPDKYRERQSIEHSGPGGGPIATVSDQPAAPDLEAWQKRHAGKDDE